MPAQPTELKIGDVAIRLHRAGSGPKLLFLHGAGGVPQWLPFFDALADHYEVLVPEHPGFGGSDDPPWIQSMSDLAMFYLDLIEEAGLDRIHLIGNSLGGWLSAEILIRDRSRFRSLTLLAPAGIRVKGRPLRRQFHLGPGRGRAQSLPRSELRGPDFGANAKRGADGCDAEEPFYRREARVAATLVQSGPREMAAPHQTTGADYLGR